MGINPANRETSIQTSENITFPHSIAGVIIQLHLVIYHQPNLFAQQHCVLLIKWIMVLSSVHAEIEQNKNRNVQHRLVTASSTNI